MRKLGLLGGAAVALGFMAGAAAAQDAPFSDPPVLTTVAPGAAAPEERPEMFGELPAPPPSGDEVVARLDVVLLPSKIWNANSGMTDDVELRAYRDALHPAAPGRPYVAPTLVSRPGQTVRVKIRNLLPPEANCPGHPKDINVPHCFNTTNLHSHGLWVSPAGISDNVLRQLPPNPDFTYEYEYNIPGDHPAGTFWYHPHVHGSTAIQVASGLAGALVIKGDRLPRVDAATKAVIPGDVDLLLRKAPDHVFVLQQIQYACRDAAGKVKTNADGTWRCDAGQVGKLDGYDLFGGPRWKNSGRFTTVNGATVEVLEQKAVAGAPERWRFVHGGVADTVKVSIRKRTGKKSLEAIAKAGAISQDALIAKECAPSSQAIAQFEIAADGLTREAVLERTSTVLQPGYRSDILVSFPETGSYCVIDEQVDVKKDAIEGSSDRRQLLFLVDVVAGQPKAATPRDQVKTLLVEAARNLPITDPALAESVVAGLERDLSLAAFKPHASLLATKPDNDQPLIFWLKVKSPDGGEGPGLGRTMATARRFDPNDFSRTLVLGDTDRWTLETADVGHPFHIHVNPFEIESVIDKNGVDLTQQAGSQYFGMKGVFKDTVFVEPEVKVNVRTHYERYIGDFVLHCHILNHEDAGMMEMVRIADRGPDGKPMALGHGLTDAVGPEGAARPHTGH
ncbi:multicopper oxidase family protein [Caulobacter endophyticus]|uniref:multicopper oxidase family protein n=1 Tax=Caulobacter endophyticus TaxID=2172652 RepID=UPI00240EE00B|nr:multicopper oxidase family protein [Caulobacter endophyticus]MDG2527177.1 multicopper oxidase family protein [Caulobacter endophyticus]